MKKTIFLLSITALLTACASPSPQKAADPNALPDGIMQPVSGTGAMGGGSFMPQVQQSAMPTTMK